MIPFCTAPTPIIAKIPRFLFISEKTLHSGGAKWFSGEGWPVPSPRATYCRRHMMRRLRHAVGLIALFLTGCANLITPPEVFVFPACNPSEFTPYQGTGSANIKGQVFLRTVIGEVRYGAGSTVTILPDTSVTRFYLENVVAAGRNDLPPDCLSGTMKRTQADGNGNYSFENLKPGSYYIISYVYWQIPGRWGHQGGQITSHVTLQPNSTASVMLTR